MPEAQVNQGGVPVLTIGGNIFSPRETTIKRYQIADTLTYVFGSHTVKGGFDYQQDKILNFFPGNFFGSYTLQQPRQLPATAIAASYVQAFRRARHDRPDHAPRHDRVRGLRAGRVARSVRR